MWDSKRQILHALHKLRKQRARKTSIVQADSKVTFHTIISSIVSCYELLVAFGLSTLNSHRTHHKQRKKKPIKTPTYVLATLQDSNTIMCTNSQTLYTEGSECLRRRQSQQTLLSFGTAFCFTLKTRSIPTVHLSTRVAK